MNQAGISLDTSVLLRIFAKEPIEQFQSAAQFLEDRLEAGVSVHVSDLAFSEAYFALQWHYGISKTNALSAFAAFIKQDQVVVSATARAVLALPNLATANPGFVDRLIHGASQAAGHTLVTFEKAAKKLPGTVVI